VDTPELIETLLEGYERRLLEPDVRTSEFVSEILAESFIEFGSAGQVFTKSEVVSKLRSEVPVEVSANGFNVQLLSQDVALVTYRTRRYAAPADEVLRSSIWRQTEGAGWQLVFHQGTPIVTRVWA